MGLLLGFLIFRNYWDLGLQKNHSTRSTEFSSTTDETRKDNDSLPLRKLSKSLKKILYLKEGIYSVKSRSQNKFTRIEHKAFVHQPLGKIQ